MDQEPLFDDFLPCKNEDPSPPQNKEYSLSDPVRACGVLRHSGADAKSIRRTLDAATYSSSSNDSYFLSGWTNSSTQSGKLEIGSKLSA